MVVCLCRGVRCNEVRRVIRAGAHTVEAVGAACGAGTDCGGCRGTVDDLLDEELEALAELDDRSPSTLPGRHGRASLPLAR